MLPIVDTHQHLWDLSKLRLPWLESAERLNRCYVTEDYLEATRGLNVVKAVYMEVDVDPAQKLAEAEYVLDLCRRDDVPTAAAVIGGQPASEGFRAYITRFKGSRYVKGVRQVLHTESVNAGLCLTEPFIKGIRLLGELGMSFDLCMRPGELRDGVTLAERCPGTRFILDHCGNADPKAFAKGSTARSHDPDVWRKDIDRLAGRKNVICKISGIVARAEPQRWRAADLAPIVNHCLDSFGSDRVVFGGDWPVCTLAATYRQWVTALHEIIRERDEPSRRKLLHDNAVRWYGLD